MVDSHQVPHNHAQTPARARGSTAYVGRFAPSPTGPLHQGSLVTALASWLDARRAGGRWLVRIEDLDTPRCVPGAAESILRTLAVHGLEWDGPVVYQNTRRDAYEAALHYLATRDLLFRCRCSRRDLAGCSRYPGTCRTARIPEDVPHALRLRVPQTTIEFSDRQAGTVRTRIDRETGDFVLKRRDGLHAYQLAVVVDDAAAGITDIVRGADLLDNTPRQILLQRLLELPTPTYRHIDVVTWPGGRKLSKQTGAPALADDAAADNLRAAMSFLQLPDDNAADVPTLLQLALDAWR